MENTSQPSFPDQLNSSTKAQASQGLIVQGYCHSVLQQPPVDLSKSKNLVDLNDKVNNGLGKAKDNANNYLVDLQPRIISNVGNIANYFDLHQALTTSVPAGSTKKEWLDRLSALRDQSAEYRSVADNLARELRKLSIVIDEDSAYFTLVVKDMNAAINGDEGELASIEGELGQIQSRIDGAIAGISLSGFAIIGGAFMIAVGAISNFVTAGTSTPLVLAGVAVLTAGIGGEVGSAIALANLNNEKSKLLHTRAQLNSEMGLALGISSGYQSLDYQAKSAVKAADSMAAAWGFLQGDLDNLVNNINKGIILPASVSSGFLNAANKRIESVQADTLTIKKQMEGVDVVIADKDRSLNDVLNDRIIQNPKYKQAA